MIRDVPEDLHRAFRAVCVQQGSTMRAAIIRLMSEVVDRAKAKR